MQQQLDQISGGWDLAKAINGFEYDLCKEWVSSIERELGPKPLENIHELSLKAP